MGYFIRLIESDFIVPENAAVLKVLTDADVRYHSHKTGGTFHGGQCLSANFSWMPQDYAETVTSVQDVFELLGFETHIHKKSGGVVLDSFDTKQGAEELFLSIVAPFVEEWSFVKWKGEDDAVWKVFVKGGKLYSKHMVWSTDTPVEFKPDPMEESSESE